MIEFLVGVVFGAVAWGYADWVDAYNQYHWKGGKFVE